MSPTSIIKTVREIGLQWHWQVLRIVGQLNHCISRQCNSAVGDLDTCWNGRAQSPDFSKNLCKLELELGTGDTANNPS